MATRPKKPVRKKSSKKGTNKPEERSFIREQPYSRIGDQLNTLKFKLCDPINSVYQELVRLAADVDTYLRLIDKGRNEDFEDQCLLNMRYRIAHLREAISNKEHP